MIQPSTLTATIAALRLLERSLDHSLMDRWERCRAFLSNEERSGQLAEIFDSWVEVCKELGYHRTRFICLRRFFSRWISGEGQIELIPVNVANQALETFRRALLLGAEPDRPANEEIVRVRMALSRAEADLCRFSGARGLSIKAGHVEQFNAPHHFKIVPLSEFMKRD